MSPTHRTQVSPKRLDWLGAQLEAWRADGLLGEDQARAIRDRYEPDTRNALATLAYFLGAAFAGVGLLWLVATNVDYDEVSPLARFLVAAALWLGFTLAGAASTRFGGPLRFIGALLFGAVVFQAAQSLQVPAYEPHLLLAWSGGALALAYGTRSVGPLVVGVATGLGWYVWALAGNVERWPAFVLGLALATPVLAAVAAAHGKADRMAGPWLRIACLTALASTWLASLPGALADEGYDLDKPAYAGIAVAILASVAAGLRTGRDGVVELVAAGGVALAGLLLVVLAPDHSLTPVFDADEMSGGVLLHALVASGVFLAVTAGVAALGVARELPGLVNLAALALVLFVTFQSFGLFAPLLSGALLFLLVGALLVVTGLLVERGRRRLHEEISQ